MNASPILPYLLVGLGNPGRENLKDRHNIGFMVVDAIAERMDLNFSKLQSKALVTQGRVAGKRIYIAKPQTFMNNSGHAVAALVRYCRIEPSRLLVIYDDIDLALGTLRMRPGGGSAGHRGMKSIIQQVGYSDFPRLRLGIGRPPGRMDPADYVLQSFSEEEQEIAKILIDKAADCVDTYLTEGIDLAMTKFNTTVEEI
jgi:PTH1 family peptidyl-tRNA hydrolase